MQISKVAKFPNVRLPAHCVWEHVRRLTEEPGRHIIQHICKVSKIVGAAGRLLAFRAVDLSSTPQSDYNQVALVA